MILKRQRFACRNDGAHNQLIVGNEAMLMKRESETTQALIAKLGTLTLYWVVGGTWKRWLSNATEGKLGKALSNPFATTPRSLNLMIPWSSIT